MVAITCILSSISSRRSFMNSSLPDSLIPTNDAERLQALAPYLVLGPAPDAVFDEVVRLTAKLFDVPIALVSLVEEGSVWFKANFGLPDGGGSGRVDRDQSICSVAILQDAPIVFEDLRREPCRLTRPDVAEALDMRFYAASPLRNAAGYAIGALCVIGREPRQLGAPEQARLQDLAGVVMKLLDLRLALHRQPEQAGAVWRQLYDQLDHSLVRLDTLAALAGYEDSPDTAAARQYGISREEEADLVTRLLDAQVTAALAMVAG